MIQHRSTGIRWRRLVTLLAAVIVAGAAAAAVLVVKVFDGPADYDGTGTGEVVVTIPPASGGQQIATILFEQKVTKSAEAFYQLAIDDERAQQITAGTYRLKKQMSAKAALTALLDKKNRIQASVTIIEGRRVSQIAKEIVRVTDFTEEQVSAALDKADELGLPDIAEGNPEGYLFPATYAVEPDTTPEQLIQQMITKTTAVAADLDIENRAKALGLTYEQVLTMASIIEWEANGSEDDRRKVARVFYNRLDQNMPLQSDATVSYANNVEGEIWTTPEQRANPSAYNTYAHAGLPPGPIGSPGEDAIEAALNPAEGSWLYFTLLDLDKGTTAFSDNLADHEKNVEKFRQYCRTHEGC